MKIIFLILIVICPIQAFAATYSITMGEGLTIPIKLDYLSETMVVLPEKPQGITGTSQPYFQVEPGQEHIMIRPLQQNAKGNIFVVFGNKTIVTLALNTVSTGGEKLVNIVYGSKIVNTLNNSVKSDNADSSAGLELIASISKVKKIRASSKKSGLLIIADYLFQTNDKIVINVSLINTGQSSYNVTGLVLKECTLGGFKGDSVLSETEIPSKIFLPTNILNHGDEVSAAVIFQKPYVDHDQEIILQAMEGDKSAAEVKIPL